MTATASLVTNGAAVVVGGVGFGAQNAGKAWSLFSRQDGYQRFDVRSGDVWMNDASSVERSELSAATTLPYDTDIWLSYAIRVPNVTITSSFFVIGQFHDTEDVGDVSRSPSLSINLDSNLFQIRTRSDANAASISNPAAVVRYSDAGFTRAVWHNLVLNVRFARTGNGFLQCWLDGSEIVSGAAIPVGYNDTTGPYFKFGAYRAAATEAVAIEYANVELGTSSLLARVTNPRPTPVGV